jgi:hypothetical protein
MLLSTVFFYECNIGGLNMIDISSFEKYMKITWNKRDKCKAKEIVIYWLNHQYFLKQYLILVKCLQRIYVYSWKINYVLYIEKLPIINCDDILDSSFL